MVLRLFNGVRAESWRRLAEEIDADLVERTFLKPHDRVIKTTGDWEIVLDGYIQPFEGVQMTRLRAAFVNPEGFRFRIVSETPLTPLSRLFQLVDEVETGDGVFDERFVCESNDPTRLKALLTDPTVKRLMKQLQHQPFRLEIKDGGPPFSIGWHADVDELVFAERLDADDLDALKALFDLFSELLDRICAHGRAYEDPIADEALPPGTSTGLRAVYGAVARATLDFPGRPERVGEGVQRKLMLDRPLEAEALVSASAPKLPSNICHVTLHAELPDSDLPLPKAPKLVGTAQVDDVGALWCVQKGLPVEHVDGAVAALVDYWRRCIEARSGLSSVGPPAGPSDESSGTP